MTDDVRFDAWPHDATGIVKEALREYVGDGDGEDENVLAEHDRSVLRRIDRQALRREIEKIAMGYDEYEQEGGAVNFWDDEIDTQQFADRLFAWLTREKA